MSEVPSINHICTALSNSTKEILNLQALQQSSQLQKSLNNSTAVDKPWVIVCTHMYSKPMISRKCYMTILFQGIAEMAGREEKSRYELLEISDPSTLLVRGKDFIYMY